MLDRGTCTARAGSPVNNNPAIRHNDATQNGNCFVFTGDPLFPSALTCH